MPLRIEHYDVLIAGAGHGGAQAALALRQHRFIGSIGIVGLEPSLPYERPPLSKEYLSGERTQERLLIRPPDFWPSKQIDLSTGTRVAGVEVAARLARLSNGNTVHYGKLIWAAGGHARRLTCDGHTLRGVHTVRSVADVDRMKQELSSTTHVAIVGGGYIGLEAAAVLRKLGKDVTIIEAQQRLLARVAGPQLSAFYESEHRAHGVNILLGSTVQCIEGQAGNCSGVRLTTGALIPAQMVVVGIGILPLVEPLLAAGADGDNGVAIDEFCRTSLPHIYAIGDCALHRNTFAGGRPIRLESIQNANDMAMTAARSILETPEPYNAVPWFWSNQYDLRLQTVGLSIDHDDSIVRGDPKNRSFSVIYRRLGRVIALDCVNAAKDFVQGKALVQQGTQALLEQLSDTTLTLKSLAGAR